MLILPDDAQRAADSLLHEWLRRADEGNDTAIPFPLPGQPAHTGGIDRPYLCQVDPELAAAPNVR